MSATPALVQEASANGRADSTATNLGPLSTLQQNQTAATNYQSQVSELTTLVQGTVSKVTKLSGQTGGLTARQADATAIAGVLSNVLLEVNGALNNVNGTLGLGKCFGRRSRNAATTNIVPQAPSSTSLPLLPTLSPVSLTVSSPSLAVSSTSSRVSSAVSCRLSA